MAIPPEARARDESSERPFKGKIAIVTGGSRGIGRAVALELSRQGAQGIVINSRPGSMTAGHEVTDEVKNLGADAHWVGGDIADEVTRRKIIEKTINEYGRIDLLVNNAGIELSVPFDEMTQYQIDRVMRINFIAPYLITLAAVSFIKNKGDTDGKKGGAIVFSSSYAADGNAGQTAYSASKGAINSFARSLAPELALSRIRVTAVELPLVETELISGLTEKQVKRVLEWTGMPKALTEQEAALALLSKAHPLFSGREQYNPVFRIGPEAIQK